MFYGLADSNILVIFVVAKFKKITMSKDSHFTGQPVYSQVLKLLEKVLLSGKTQMSIENLSEAPQNQASDILFPKVSPL